MSEMLPFTPARFESLKHVTSRNFEFAHHRVTDLVHRLRHEESNFYLFLSKNDAWEESELLPPKAHEKYNEWIDLWNEMNVLYRIVPPDVTLAIRRIDWNFGLVYDEYDDTEELLSKNFYVMTNELHIYKCISNNQRSPSRVKPSHSSLDVFKTSDGYKWKYMTTISKASLEKFYIENFIPLTIATDPIQTIPGTEEIDTLHSSILVRASAKPGSIEHFKIEHPGDNYEANSRNIPLFIEGNGKQNATGKCKIEAHEGFIYNIEVYDPGINYRYTTTNRSFPIAIRQLTENGLVQSAYGIAHTEPSGMITRIELVKQLKPVYETGIGYIVQSSCNGWAETNEAGEITNAEIYLGQSGEDFTRANVIIIDKNGVNGSIRAIISPEGGHGANISKELFAGYAMVNIRIFGDFDDDFIMSDSFRRIGIIENPEESDDYYISHDAEMTSKSWSLTLTEIVDITERVTSFKAQDYIEDSYITLKYIGANVVNEVVVNTAISVDNYPEQIIDPFYRRTEILHCNNDYTNVLVTGSLEGNVWGNNITGYTDNSDWNAAAVHAGLIKVNETAIISRRPKGLISRFTGTIANQIHSMNYNDSWCGIQLSLASPYNLLKDRHIDAKTRLALTNDHIEFKDGETIIGLTSGTMGKTIHKYRNNILRVTIDDQSFVEQPNNRFRENEYIQGLESKAIAQISSIVNPRLKRYSGMIIHYNNISPIERMVDEQIEVITIVLNYMGDNIVKGDNKENE